MDDKQKTCSRVGAGAAPAAVSAVADVKLDAPPSRSVSPVVAFLAAARDMGVWTSVGAAGRGKVPWDQSTSPFDGALWSL